MNIAGASKGMTQDEYKRRLFYASLSLLKAKEREEISEFDRLLREGRIKRDEKNPKKVWFVNKNEQLPSRGV